MCESKSKILAWVEKADHDLGSAKLIYLHIPEYFDTIAFHCQQAVEKYLKCLLIYNKLSLSLLNFFSIVQQVVFWQLFVKFRANAYL